MTKQLSFTCKVGASSAVGTIVHKFLVAKGSRVNDVKPSLKRWQKTYYNKRKELENKNIIKDNEFKEDYIFDSLSEASCVILGTSSANFTHWKLSSEQSLHNIWDNPRRVRGKGKKTG